MKARAAPATARAAPVPVPAAALVGTLPAAALAVLAALAALAGLAGGVQGQADADPGVEATGGGSLTVLMFHPFDGVDPLGFDAGGGLDAFAARYGPLVADKGRFDFPFLVVDGVLPVEGLPDPDRPYASALESYGQAVRARLGDEPAATLRLASLHATGDSPQVVVQVAVAPRADLATEDLRLRLALVEDHVHYQPPPGLTNGVTDHRFTVRAYADLGRIDGAGNWTRTFPLRDGWASERLTVAAWLQQGAPSPRFEAREVAQATHAPLGASQVQSAKGVLVEMLSATWCDPCLFGDEAVEALAVEHGVATRSEPRLAARYFEAGPRDWAMLAAAAGAGALLVALARRGR